MQFGIAVLMGPNFYQMIICQLLWVPWDRVVSAATSKMRFKEKYTVLYDGACGLCGRTIEILQSLDLLGGIEYMDAVKDWPSIRRRFSTLSQEQCLADMHVIAPKGQVYSGFYGYRALCKVLPLGWLVLPLLYLPGVPAVGMRVYRAVAAGRHNGTCALPGAPMHRVADISNSR
jgi:predicted DCC family thiol-disulfide oxidoreductase YuxK